MYEIYTTDESRQALTVTIPYIIELNHYLHCGNCLTVCPVGAVERR